MRLQPAVLHLLRQVTIGKVPYVRAAVFHAEIPPISVCVQGKAFSPRLA
jgi:hypothetical protein